MAAQSDVNKLISLIKNKHSIWNYKSRFYRKKDRLKYDWQTISAVMIPDFYKKNNRERDEIVRKFKMKWQTLRSKFLKHRKAIKENKECDMDIFPYYNDLHFLSDLYKEDNTLPYRKSKNVKMQISTTAKDENKLFLMSILPDFQKIITFYKLVAKHNILNIIEYYVKQFTSRFNNNSSLALQNENNVHIEEDKTFFMSLLNYFHMIPLEQNLNLKKDIMDVILKYIKMSSNDVYIDRMIDYNCVDQSKSRPIGMSVTTEKHEFQNEVLQNDHPVAILSEQSCGDVSYYQIDKATGFLKRVQGNQGYGPTTIKNALPYGKQDNHNTLASPYFISIYEYYNENQAEETIECHGDKSNNVYSITEVTSECEAELDNSEQSPDKSLQCLMNPSEDENTSTVSINSLLMDYHHTDFEKWLLDNLSPTHDSPAPIENQTENEHANEKSIIDYTVPNYYDAFTSALKETEPVDNQQAATDVFLSDALIPINDEFVTTPVTTELIENSGFTGEEYYFDPKYYMQYTMLSNEEEQLTAKQVATPKTLPSVQVNDIMLSNTEEFLSSSQHFDADNSEQNLLPHSRGPDDYEYAAIQEFD